jgi:hypothetical protein
MNSTKDYFLFFPAESLTPLRSAKTLWIRLEKARVPG